MLHLLMTEREVAMSRKTMLPRSFCSGPPTRNSKTDIFQYSPAYSAIHQSMRSMKINSIE